MMNARAVFTRPVRSLGGCSSTASAATVRGASTSFAAGRAPRPPAVTGMPLRSGPVEASLQAPSPLPPFPRTPSRNRATTAMAWPWVGQDPGGWQIDLGMEAGAGVGTVVGRWQTVGCLRPLRPARQGNPKHDTCRLQPSHGTEPCASPSSTRTMWAGQDPARSCSYFLATAGRAPRPPTGHSARHSGVRRQPDVGSIHVAV